MTEKARVDRMDCSEWRFSFYISHCFNTENTFPFSLSLLQINSRNIFNMKTVQRMFNFQCVTWRRTSPVILIDVFAMLYIQTPHVCIHRFWHAKNFSIFVWSKCVSFHCFLGCVKTELVGYGSTLNLIPNSMKSQWIEEMKTPIKLYVLQL